MALVFFHQGSRRDRTLPYGRKQLFFQLFFVGRTQFHPMVVICPPAHTSTKISCAGGHRRSTGAGCAGVVKPGASPELRYNALTFTRKVSAYYINIKNYIVTKNFSSVTRPQFVIKFPAQGPAHAPVHRKSRREGRARPAQPPVQNRGGFFSVPKRR